MPENNFKSLEAKWGISFRQPELLCQALTHRSYLNEHPEFSLAHNERLEFLGDAVLSLVVTAYIFNQYPDQNEGELTAYRAALVNWEILGAVAAEAGLNEHLLLSRGEQKDSGRARAVILANTIEAVIGAIFLDQGYTMAEKFIARYLFPKLEAIVQDRSWQDSKSLFQERAQAEFNLTPNYKVLHQSGPDHDKVFTVGLYLGEELVAEGEGPSKQRAEQVAARAGLITRGWQSAGDK